MLTNPGGPATSSIDSIRRTPTDIYPPGMRARFDIVTGGPESVPLLGWHRTPLWRGDAVYLPSYAPLYGTAADVLPEIQRLAAQGDALWLPVVLHWGWEADEGWEDLRRLAEAAAPYAADWQDFLDSIERTKGP